MVSNVSSSVNTVLAALSLNSSDPEASADNSLGLIMEIWNCLPAGWCEMATNRDP
jgi:hypothetical protein